MALEAPRLNIEMSFLDPMGQPCPAGQLVAAGSVVQGALTDKEAIRALIKDGDVDVLTVEIEHVGVETLAELELEGVNVQPSARVLTIIRDKLVQKDHFVAHGIPLAPYCKTSSVDEIKEAAATLGLPIMLKSRKGGYDGRGNAVLESTDDISIAEALKKLSCDATATADSTFDLYAEGWVAFDCEIAVMVVRSANGIDSCTYPAVNAIQQDSVCRVVLAPARNISHDIRTECERIAQQAIDSLGAGASGMFGVELFVSGTTVLLNEVAPRPHNTGHYTQDACAVSQFENHLRGVCGLPLGSTQMIVEAAASEYEFFSICVFCILVDSYIRVYSHYIALLLLLLLHTQW